MLRDEKREPMPRPVPIPREEPAYERPEYDKPNCPNYNRPDYNCPDFRYPMMPMYPNNMNPCPYPYPERDMYGDKRMDIEEMMRRNPMLKRCVLDCIERCGCGCKPYNMKPMPRRETRRPCYGLDESSIYEFSDEELESFIEITEKDENIKEES